MVNNRKHTEQLSERLDRVFHSLSVSTRRDILSRIAEREWTVTELAEPFQMSLAAVSKHLKVLENAGLLTRTIDGRIHRCQINVEPLQSATDVIEKYRAFWKGQFDALESFLKKSQINKKEK
jgi:DNA-binding transcriptional ArsR family regulator